MKLLVWLYMSFLVGCTYADGDSKEGLAKSEMSTIAGACKKYYTENIEWPTQLEDIANSLESKSLLDPWGNEYHFAIELIKENDDTVTQKLVIWTEREKDGKSQVLSWPEDAKVTKEMREDAKKEQLAKIDTRIIENAVKRYYLDKRMWPTKLTDIANARELGEKTLIDPWGKNYQFVVERTKSSDGKEVDNLYVWSERTVNGMKRVCGKKPAERKKK